METINIKGIEVKVVKGLQINNTDLIINEKPERETEKAALFTVMNYKMGRANAKFWIPKSVYKMENEKCIMADWFVNKSFSSIC